MPKTLTSVDVGVKWNAAAEWVDGELVNVGLDINSIIPDEIAIEKPQWDGRSEEVWGGTILDLAWCGARYLGRLEGSRRPGVTEYTPTMWKGSEAKPHSHRRIYLALTEDERELIGGFRTWEAIERACEKWGLKRGKVKGADCYKKSDKKLTDILDAVGVGLFHLGRLEKV